MKEIYSDEMEFKIIYNDEEYIMSDREELEIGDIFFDRRDNIYREVESITDIRHMSYTAPEWYTIFERA